MLDIDPQRSVARWHALRAAHKTATPITLSDISGWRLAAELDRLRQTHDVLLIDSPPQIDMDAKLAKTVKSERFSRMSMQLFMEALNVFNHPSFLVGDQSINSQQFGKVTSMATISREIQLGLKIAF